MNIVSQMPDLNLQFDTESKERMLKLDSWDQELDKSGLKTRKPFQ